MHGFWRAAEAGLDDWAARFPADAEAVAWSAPASGRPVRRRPRRARRAPADAAPELPPVADTDAALGRLYVLEGSTLGGMFIDRHLAGLPGSVRRPAAGLLPLRRRDRRHVARLPARRPATAWPPAGTPTRCSSAATGTFRALAQWCRPGSAAA